MLGLFEAFWLVEKIRVANQIGGPTYGPDWTQLNRLAISVGSGMMYDF